MKIKAIIIDDEPKLREVLDIKIRKNCPNVDVVGKASNASMAYDLILKLKPQLIFLDIQMPGESGFELLERFDTFDFEIIFVTGYNEFALKAFKVSAVDYVLKPIQNSDLVLAIEKAAVRILDKEKIARYELLKHNLKITDSNNIKIVIPGSSFYQFVEVNTIIHCEGWQKYTKIHLENSDVILSSYNIGVFRDLLSNYDFYSPHKSHLVNMNKITKYSMEGEMSLTNGNLVPVSRRRKEKFILELGKYGMTLN